MPSFYILIDKKVKRVPPNQCAAPSQVNKTYIKNFIISTVFLGIDHNIDDDYEDWNVPENHTPLLFETMIFDQSSEECLHDYQMRYSTYDQAQNGHCKVVEIFQKHLIKRNKYKWPEGLFHYFLVRLIKWFKKMKFSHRSNKK